MNALSKLWMRVQDLGGLYMGIGELWPDEPPALRPPVEPAKFER